MVPLVLQNRLQKVDDSKQLIHQHNPTDKFRNSFLRRSFLTATSSFSKNYFTYYQLQKKGLAKRVAMVGEAEPISGL